MRLPHQSGTRLKFDCHKQAVWIFAIVSERGGLFEAVFLIKRLGWSEVGHCSCFQTKSPVAPVYRLRNNVSKDETGDALPQVRPGRAHGVHFQDGVSITV